MLSYDNCRVCIVLFGQGITERGSRAIDRSHLEGSSGRWTRRNAPTTGDQGVGGQSIFSDKPEESPERTLFLPRALFSNTHNLFSR